MAPFIYGFYFGARQPEVRNIYYPSISLGEMYILTARRTLVLMEGTIASVGVFF